MRNEILNKLERLQEYVKILNSYKQYTIQDINEDFTLRGAIERYLEGEKVEERNVNIERSIMVERD